jgi:uncharacterized protein
MHNLPMDPLPPAAEAVQPPQFSPAPGPQTFNEYVRFVFLGPNGLRAGWRLLIYMAMVVGIVLGLGALAQLLHVKGTIWGSAVGEGLLLIAALLPAVIMSLIEKRPFGAYGLPGRNAFRRPFWVGAVWGFVAISALLLIMRALHVFYFGGLALSGVRILKFAAFWGIFFLGVGFAEEFLFRGYTQFTLTQGIGFWPTAIILSCIFGGVHLGNAGEGCPGALAAGLIGFFFALTLRRTGDLWFAVGFHAAWDWCESYLYSVPDSGGMVPGHLINSSFQGPKWLTGGSIGPEGSALVFVVIVLVWIAFDRMYPKAVYPPAAV